MKKLFAAGALVMAANTAFAQAEAALPGVAATTATVATVTVLTIAGATGGGGVVTSTTAP